ncbi:MAG TPA: DUF885 domain-containing protein [Polyangia bacterium]|nr:DUF885 domain-containing protein [Polyangia bacterium]
MLLPALGLGLANLGCKTVDGAAVGAGSGGPSVTVAPPGGGAPLPPDQALAALAAQYWEQRLLADPIEATEIGDRRFDDRMPDLTPEAHERELARRRALRDRVAALDEARQSPPDRVTRGLLLGEIDADLARGECHLDEWSVDPRDGPQVAFLQLAELQTVNSVGQARAMTARWQKMAQTIDERIANLRRGLAAGKVATREAVTRVIGQLDQLLARPDAEWPLRTPASAERPSWSEADRRSFAAALDAAIAGSIRPAFARYRAVLLSEILPRARDQAHVGLLNVPGGTACYPRLIQLHTSLPLTPDEIHGVGLAEVARLRAEVVRLGAELLHSSEFAEIRRRLQSDRALFFQTRADVEAKAAAALARSTAAMPQFLGKLPRTTCTVKRIAAYEEADSPIAYYRPPAIDGSRGGTYYINTSEPATRPRYEAEALAFHESIPGHHVQIAIAQELAGLPEFRKHIGVTAFVEGWGLYAERLSDELGLYSGPLDRIGMLSLELWRAGRLVVDTGMHAFGWSRQRAIDYLEANTVIAHNNVVNEVDRYIGWPGQALAYKIGQREILALRALAERRLGPRFDRRAFHDVVLGSGAVSLPVLRAQVASWLADGAR